MRNFAGESRVHVLSQVQVEMPSGPVAGHCQENGVPWIHQWGSHWAVDGITGNPAGWNHARGKMREIYHMGCVV